MLLLFIIGLVLFFVLTLPRSVVIQSADFVVGEVARQDVTSPAHFEFVSEVKTEEARALSERSVLPVFTQADPGITRQQIDQLALLLDEIEKIRNNKYIQPNEKRDLISRTSGNILAPETVEQLLLFSDQRWNLVRSESLRVIESVMRSSVRDENIDLKKESTETEASLALTDVQTKAVVSLSSPFIVANSFFSPDLTDAARQQAREMIQPISVAFAEGEIVIQKGRILTDFDIEVLQKMGILASDDPLKRSIGIVGILSVLSAFLGIYYHRQKPRHYYSLRGLLLAGILLVGFVVAARFVIPNRVVLPYLLPLPAFSLLLATLFGTEIGLIYAVVLSILAPFGFANGQELTIFYLLTSLVGVAVLGKAYRISAFAWAGLLVGLSGLVIIISFRISTGQLDWQGLVTLAIACFANGIASASMALLLQYFLGDLLGLITTLRLLEISRSDAPLLKHFLRSAPGTYQHSLMVANLVEQAGEKLGIDPLLLRVGALYHDIGKTENPAFFIENQLPTNLDAHDDIPVETAANLVIRHVTDGENLAKKYRLPARIIDFINEHHGTLTAKYLYNRALSEAGGDITKVDAKKFRYPGPSPRSKETGLLMLADNIEARTRSERPTSETEIRKLVDKAIDGCIKEEQFVNTPFTLRDLTAIAEAFTTTLTGLYHPRIAYPNNENVTTGRQSN